MIERILKLKEQKNNRKQLTNETKNDKIFISRAIFLEGR